MKTTFALLATLILSSSAFAKIVSNDHRYFVSTNGKEQPIHLLNSLIENKQVSAIKIYAGGNINVISFAKKGGAEKLYSIDDKGYMYAIEPFANYRINKIDRDNMIRFAEAPSKRFFVNNKGFFIYK